MNSSNAKQFLPLVQALAEGKTIQIRDPYKGDVWEDGFNVEFSFGPERYRVKPVAPRELFEVRYKGGSRMVIEETLKEAQRTIAKCAVPEAWEIITFTENL